jgi:hypothetical protein
MPQRVRLDLHRRVARGVDGAEREFLERRAGDGRAVPAHQHDPMGSQRARQRGAFFGLRYDQAGVAEFVA